VALARVLSLDFSSDGMIRRPDRSESMVRPPKI
jgi:hypothetical protein